VIWTWGLPKSEVELGRAHLTYEGPTQSLKVKLLRFKWVLTKFGLRGVVFPLRAREKRV
jgi:hypothetical protein